MFIVSSTVFCASAIFCVAKSKEAPLVVPAVARSASAIFASFRVISAFAKFDFSEFRDAFASDKSSPSFLTFTVSNLESTSFNGS